MSPIYRAFYKAAQGFVEGALTTDNKFLVESPSGRFELDGVVIDYFTGLYTEKGQPVYQHDIVKYGVLNEFGSMRIFESVVRYSVVGTRFFFDCKEMAEKDGLMDVKGFHLFEVIGQNHD